MQERLQPEAPVELGHGADSDSIPSEEEDEPEEETPGGEDEEAN